MSGWDRNDPAEWATPPRDMTAREAREIEATMRRIERSGWNPGDADEWAPVPARRIADQHDEARLPMVQPDPPAIRVWVVAIAFALIVLGGVIGIVGSVPGAVNSATVVTWVLGVIGIGLIVGEVRR